MERRSSIFIVEDDAVIAGEVAKSLSGWGFAPHVCEDFARVLEEFERLMPELVIMDISLPFYNGYYWCEKIRERSGVPVIFLSSHTESTDVVMAVSMGGDDYIVKPVSQEVLVAKVRAMLRRAYDYEPEAPARIGNARLDAGASCLVAGDARIDLTRNELRILQTLLHKAGQVVSREQLMLALWDSDAFVDDNTLTVNVNRLRHTLEEAGLPGCIVTYKGQGYSLHAPEAGA